MITTALIITVKEENYMYFLKLRKKDRQHNSQAKKGKRTNNDLQNITQKTKDQVT
jgi:hypothetical protein